MPRYRKYVRVSHVGVYIKYGLGMVRCCKHNQYLKYKTAIAPYDIVNLTTLSTVTARIKHSFPDHGLLNQEQPLRSMR